MYLMRNISKLKEGTLEYQEAYGERMASGSRVNCLYKTECSRRSQLRRDNIQENFDLTSQGFDAIMQLNEAFAKDDEGISQESL